MLWMAVTPDRFELPLCVEDSADKLAHKLNTSRSNVLTQRHRKNSGERCGYKVVAVKE